jgi:hypothetical protein
MVLRDRFGAIMTRLRWSALGLDNLIYQRGVSGASSMGEASIVSSRCYDALRVINLGDLHPPTLF